MADTDPAPDQARHLERRASFWQSLCAAFLAGGALLLMLAGILWISGGAAGGVPAAIAGVAAASFVLSYGSSRVCAACWRRCDRECGGTDGSLQAHESSHT